MTVSDKQRCLPQILWAPLFRERTEQDCACSTDEPTIWYIKAKEEITGETDCACAVAVHALAAVGEIGKALYQTPTYLYRSPLLSDHQVAFNPASSAGVVVLNGPAARVLDSYTEPAPLTDPTARQLAALGLLAPARATEYVVRNAPHTLTLWLHLTTRCNLHCAYCYAPRGNVDMSPEVGRAAVDGAIRSALARGFQGLKLKYAGGEPTLNFPTLRAVHEYAQTRAAQAGLGLREVLLTNGTTLTPALLRWLRNKDIRLSISLDGIGSAHDRQRVGKDGNGTFALVAKGIEQALALGLAPHLSITVTTYNVDGLADVVAFALERDLPFNLNFVRPVLNQPDLTPSPERLIAGIQAALGVIEARLPRRRLVDGLLDRCDLSAPHRYPCGAGRSYLVVGPQGEVAPCHMELERTVGTVWEEDPLALVRAAEGFDNPPVEEKGSCRECLWRYICAGGCPLLTDRLRGGEGHLSPYCTVYRTLLPELMRLEGLRLLRREAERN